MKPKEKEKPKFDPDKAKTFSNKRTVTTESGRVFTVYDVEDTENGQRDVCHALFACYETSPWCLSTFTATGEPTESAKKYWSYYNAIPRKIAYENGKPVAFCSDKSDNNGTKGSLNGFDFIKVSDDSAYAWDEQSIPQSELDKLISDGLVKYEGQVLWLTEKGMSKANFDKPARKEAWWDLLDI